MSSSHHVDKSINSKSNGSSLPDSAFCGPNRTYPSHDKDHVKGSVNQLEHDKLDPQIKRRIFECLQRKGKRMGIEVEESKIDEPNKDEEIIEWYLKKLEKEKVIQNE